MNRDEWLEARKSGVGASESPVLLGLSPWGCPLELWQRKLGLAAEIEETERMRWGARLQPIIAREVEAQMGCVVFECDPYQSIRHPELAFMVCTPDARLPKETVADPWGISGVLEIKTASPFKGGEWEDAPPEHYRCQVIHQMIVTGCRWGMLAVLIGGQELRIARIEWDQDMADKIIEACRTFWGYVEREEAPPADAMPATKAALETMHPVDDGESIELPLEAIEIDATVVQAQEAIKRYKKIEAAGKNRLRQLIGDASFGILPDQSGRWSCKVVKVAPYQHPGSNSRQLQRLKL